MKSYKNGRIQNIDKCEEHDYREKKRCITIKSKAEGSKIDPRKVRFSMIQFRAWFCLMTFLLLANFQFC